MLITFTLLIKHDVRAFPKHFDRRVRASHNVVRSLESPQNNVLTRAHIIHIILIADGLT